MVAFLYLIFDKLISLITNPPFTGKHLVYSGKH